jgi:hypothetical protein
MLLGKNEVGLRRQVVVTRQTLEKSRMLFREDEVGVRRQVVVTRQTLEKGRGRMRLM